MHKKLNSISGMSLVEVSMAMAIFSALTIGVFSILRSTTNLQAHDITKDSLRTQAEISLNWIMEQFQDVTEDSVVRARNIDGLQTADSQDFKDASFVRYKKITSVNDNGNGVYTRSYSTKEYSIGFRIISGEYPTKINPHDNRGDGNDNNKNGLVDEGEIVFKEYDNSTVPDYLGRVVKVICPNVMRKYDADPSDAENLIQGFSVSCQSDDAANPSRWMVRVSIALEKVDPTGQFLSAGSALRRSTKVYYKTTTLALYK